MHYTFKLILAGDGGVGKTTLVDRYVNGSFRENTRMTMGVQFMVKRLNVNGDHIDLQIWDFGGEERFRFILPAYCRGAHGAIFMYDLTSPDSLYHMDDWLSVLRSQGGLFPIIIGGTKADLMGNRKVTPAEASSLATRHGFANVFEISSKTGQNVDAIFESLCLQMIQAIRPASESPYSKEVIPIVNLTI